MCDRYSQIPKDLVCNLEAFIMNELKSSDSLSDENFGRFEQYLVRRTAKVCNFTFCAIVYFGVCVLSSSLVDKDVIVLCNMCSWLLSSLFPFWFV